MKKNFLSMAAAAALLMATAAVLPANATEAEGQSEEAGMLMPTPKKKTTKKSTSKKSSTKKSTKKSSTKKTTTTKSTAKTAETETPATTTSTETSNGSTLADAAGGVLSSIFGGSSSGSSIASALTSIFDKNKVATADQLVGTWKYTEPAVVFESSNALKNIGGKVASSAIEKKLASYFQKVGIKKGTLKMTFDKDGNFTQTLGKKTLTGTYTTSGKQVVLTYSTGLKQLVGTTQVDGNSLLIVMEAGKLLKYAGSLGKLTGNSTISTLSSLLGSYDGMEVGLRLQK